MKIIKKNILLGLHDAFSQNKQFIHDIWIYGNLNFCNKIDKASDLDIIVVYKKKPVKIKFNKELRSLIRGSLIYIPQKIKNGIFLFETLKVYSVLKEKILCFKKKKNRNLINLTSFLERYYERRVHLNKINYYNLDYISLGKIKSLIFSYTIFSYIYKINNKYLKEILKNYNSVRKLYINEKLPSKKFDLFLNKIRSFDEYFFKESYSILEKKYHNIPIKNFKIRFLGKYNFKYSYKSKKNDIPKIFAYLYIKYSTYDLNLSKLLRKDVERSSVAISYKNKKFDNYLKRKMIFLNKCFVDLKKHGFKKGLYRLNNYL